MPIPRETIDNLRDSINIVELIGEYLPNLKRVGKDYTALCPFHSEKSPSFYISPSKNIFHCFGCKAGGDVFKFLMLHENISYPEAIKKLATRAGIVIKEIDEQVPAEKRAVLEILNSATAFYHKHLVDSDKAAHARAYLEKRGMNAQTIEKFQLGYAPEGNALLAQAAKKHSTELLLKSGLIAISDRDSKPYDFMRNRIVFPIYDFSGNTIAFGGRTLKADVQPLYLNTPDSLVYSKSRSLYGLFQAKSGISKSKKTVILEGYMDVLMCHQHGVDNAIAPLGTSLTEDQLKFIKRFIETALLIFDSDDSGREAAMRAGELCLENEIFSKIVSLPEKMDPDEYLIKNGRDSFDRLIETGVNPVEFKTHLFSMKNDISQPEKKSIFLKNALETVIKVKDPVFRHEMVKFLSQKLEIDETLIISEMRKASVHKRTGRQEPAAAKPTVTGIRSAEEEIISLCIQHPELISMVDPGIFGDERCSGVFPFLSRLNDKEPFAKIADMLDEDLAKWFIQLAFETGKYDSPKQKMETLLRDINTHQNEKRRRDLEKEVIPMWDGKTKSDPVKIKEFQELTKMLKGSAAR
ncbi:MAG: DNA primase [Elusimicrobia bacterium RIFOXYB2_FULL_48_7]|nr:MAG: DNA primase [Elusimicrobia bacterium RIFOXYB2_FULL_48_7]